MCKPVLRIIFPSPVVTYHDANVSPNVGYMFTQRTYGQSNVTHLAMLLSYGPMLPTCSPKARMAVLAFAVQRFTAIMLCQKFLLAATYGNTALCWHAG